MKYKCITEGFKTRGCKADLDCEKWIKVVNGEILSTEDDYIVKDGFLLCHKDSILAKYHFIKVEEECDDLISRKSLIEHLNQFAPEHYNAIVNDLIVKETAAFNKEKVIEELMNWKNSAEKRAAKYDSLEDINNMDIQDAIAIAYRNAIKVVEKGGVE